MTPEEYDYAVRREPMPPEPMAFRGWVHAVWLSLVAWGAIILACWVWL